VLRCCLPGLVILMNTHVQRLSLTQTKISVDETVDAYHIQYQPSESLAVLDDEGAHLDEAWRPWPWQYQEH
jgi:hypothetical protein